MVIKFKIPACGCNGAKFDLGRRLTFIRVSEESQQFELCIDFAEIVTITYVTLMDGSVKFAAIVWLERKLLLSLGASCFDGVLATDLPRTPHFIKHPECINMHEVFKYF